MRPYVTILPTKFAIIDKDAVTNVVVTVNFSDLTDTGYIDGVIQAQMLDGNRRFSIPLPILISAVRPQVFSISGTVTTGGGITVTASGPEIKQTKTEADGTFSIEGLPAGIYQVAPTHIGTVFDPVRQEVDLEGHDVTGLIFNGSVAPEGLSPEILQRLDEMPDVFTPDSEIILPNGIPLDEYIKLRGIKFDEDLPLNELPNTELVLKIATAAELLPPASGPQEKKNDVIAKMLGLAKLYACGRNTPSCTTWDFPADQSKPITKPAQQGMTYVYGGKNPLVRTLPTDGCSEETHGVDCSGLIYRIAAGAGISLPVGTAATQGNPDQWGIPEDWKLKMVKVTDGSRKAGDILVWSGHIGIADGAGNVISSTGRPGDCQKNIKPPRGPRSLPEGVFEPVKTRLRLASELSGIFDMSIKCVSYPQIVGVVRFEINNEDGGPFSASGNGTDIGGAPLCFSLNGDYNQSANVLSGLLSLCDNSRSDSFSVELLQDTTDFFPLQKVIDNGGCLGEAKLARIPEGSTSSRLLIQALEESSTVPSVRFGGP